DNSKRGKYNLEISLNEDHEIFKGHFPGSPVVPGVCQVQIIREICEDITGKKLFIHKVSNIKYMAMIVPGQFDTLNISIELTPKDEEYSLTASIFKNEIVFLKYKGSFLVQ
ncbi:MAG: 3-hydroxyacyl-ACP dehydratase, partial [Marinilabiliales bacterium]